MVGRRSTRNCRVNSEPLRNEINTNASSLNMYPNSQLGKELIETVVDVKENIPAAEHPVKNRSRSAANRIHSLSTSSDSADQRKRPNSEIGPPAKRKSVEYFGKIKSGSMCQDKISEYENEPSSSSSESSKLERSREDAIEEEEGQEVKSANDSNEEVFTSAINYDDDDDYEEDEEEEYDEDETEDDDEKNKPLENENFVAMRERLNDFQLINAPKAMKTNKLNGIGSPSEVWSVMVSRDDVSRASKCLLNNHPGLDFKMRSVLLDWMMEVCEAELLHRETFHLAADYVDRFFECSPIMIDKYSFQLVGTTALFIASKYEEIFPPKCEEFSSLTDGGFTVAHVLQMEVLMVRSLDWTLGPITSIQWLSTYLQLLNSPVHSENEHCDEANYFVPEFMRDDFIHMSKILDYLLFEDDSLQYTYRTISAAVLFACYEPRTAVENATGFNYDQLYCVIEYVDPVVTVFDTFRIAGDPLPANEKISAEDAHNIQTHFHYEKVKPLVDAERKKRKH